MKKMYQMFSATQFTKRSTDTTQVLLEGIGWSPDHGKNEGRINSGGTSQPSRIELTFPDELTPKLHQVYLIAVEPITIPEGAHISDYQKQLVTERQLKDEQGEGVALFGNTGRKFK